MLNSTVYSNEPTPTPPIKHKRVVKGDRVPFGGVLLTNSALAKMITAYEQKIKFLEIELVKTQKDCFTQLDTKEKQCSVRLEGNEQQLTACQHVVTSCERSLLETKTPPWYQNPYVNFLLGSVMSGGICTAVVLGSR